MYAYNENILNTWNQLGTISNNELNEKFEEDDALCIQALQYMQTHIPEIAKDKTITTKVLGCLPERCADDPEFNKLLDIMQKAQQIGQDITSSGDLKPFDKDLQATLFSYIQDNKTSLALNFLDHGVAVTEDMLFAAFENSNEEIIKKLLDKGLNINAENKEGNTPLHLAAMEGWEDIALLLIEKGADVNKPNSKETTPLFYAAEQSLDALVETLIKKGADINHRNSLDHNPLEWVLSDSDWEFKMQLQYTADLLIQNGATLHEDNESTNMINKLLKRFEKKNIEGGEEKGAFAHMLQNIMLKYIDKKNTYTVLDFVNHGVPVTEKMLFSATKLGNLRIVKEFAKKNVNLEATDEAGDTPLIIAAKSNFEDLSLFFLDQGSAVNHANKDGSTALHYAVENKLYGLVDQLIEKKADINLTTHNGETPLFIACITNSMQLVDLLISEGADVNIADKQGNTVLILACKQDHYDIADLILKNNPDVNKVNEAKSSDALKWAILDEKFDIALEILQRKEKSFWGPAKVSLKLLEDPKGEEILKSACEGFDFLEFAKASPDKEEEEVIQSWLEKNPQVPKGRTALEIPFIFGVEAVALNVYKNMSPEEQTASLSLLKARFGAKEVEQRFYNNVLFKVNPSHYDGGREIAEKVPSPLPVDNLELVLQDLHLIESYEKRDNIKKMVQQIKNRERLHGHDEKSDEEVEKWYSNFSCYLSHIIQDYKIGSPEGDEDIRKQVLGRLAEMQSACAPRWKDEAEQLYATRPKGEEAEEEESVLTVGDYLLQRLRNERVHIVTSQLGKGEENIHEPNYLLDTLGDDLGLRLDKVNDPFGTELAYSEMHPTGEPLDHFEKIYTPYYLVSEITDHLRAQQKREVKSKDLFDLSPGKVYDWLRENVAVNWKEEEYEAIPSKIQEMKASGKSKEEIQTFLNRYGISAPDIESRIAEGEKALKLQLQSIESRLKTAEANSKRFPNNNQLKNQVNTLTGDRERIRGIQEALILAPSKEEKMVILEKNKLIEGQKEVFKLAQIAHFFNTEIYDENKMFTPNAAVHLLKSVNAIADR